MTRDEERALCMEYARERAAKTGAPYGVWESAVGCYSAPDCPINRRGYEGPAVGAKMIARFPSPVRPC